MENNLASTPSFRELDKGDDQNYLLDRSYAAASRLNLQSYFWKESCGFNIHPCIPVGDTCVIADVPAGTCSWLIGVSREVSWAELDGFDIDLSQAPHAKWLPKNVKIHHWNVFEDPPSDCLRKYDIVHVRLLVLAMQKSNLDAVMARLQAMLKPGGYLQWDDLNCIDMHVRKVDPDIATPALDQLRTMCYSDGRHDWVLDIPSSMSRAGLENASAFHFTDPIELARAVNEKHLMTIEEFAGSLTKAGKVDEAKSFHQTIAGAYRESLQGAGLCIPGIVCVGRMPM